MLNSDLSYPWAENHLGKGKGMDEIQSPLTIASLKKFIQEEQSHEIPMEFSIQAICSIAIKFFIS